MSGLTWSVVVFTTTAAYHLAGRGRGSACSNVKSCAALKQNRLVRWLVSRGVCDMARLASEADSGSMVRVVAVGRQAAFNCWHDRTPAGRVVFC